MLLHEVPTVTAATLSAWYRDHARDLLAHTGSDLVTELGGASTKEGPSLALPICVAGVAGVGKSTLLNSLLSDRLSLLPQGGVGSFTSTPIRIVHADEPYLAIRRPRDAASKLMAAMAQQDERAVIALQEARLLVRGTQFCDASAEYVLDMLRSAVQGRVGERAAIGDRGRLSILADILTSERLGTWITWNAGAQLPELRHELEHNAAGFLSPLASEVELGWSTPLLGNVQLVDLPGLGVAHDVLARRTKRALAGARACMLVVDRSGIPEIAADALRPIFTRLAIEADPEGSRLLVAVTHLDQIASDRRAHEPAKIRRPWQAHFDELSVAARELVRGQLAQQLASAGAGGEPDRTRRSEIASRVRVIQVAPLEHRRYHRQDPEERSRLTSEDGGGVLRLRREIVALGAAWIRALTSRLLRALGQAVGLQSRQFGELHRALQLAANHAHKDEKTP